MKCEVCGTELGAENTVVRSHQNMTMDIYCPTCQAHYFADERKGTIKLMNPKTAGKVSWRTKKMREAAYVLFVHESWGDVYDNVENCPEFTKEEEKKIQDTVNKMWFTIEDNIKG
jgi:hypothetical protein